MPPWKPPVARSVKIFSERRREHESGKSFLTRDIVAKILVGKPLLKCRWDGDRELGIRIHPFVEHFAKRVSVVPGNSLEKAHQPWAFVLQLAGFCKSAFFLQMCIDRGRLRRNRQKRPLVVSAAGKKEGARQVIS